MGKILRPKISNLIYELSTEPLIFSKSFFPVLTVVLCPRQDVLSQFSMVNLELFNIVEDIKKVSKAFVVHPKNVNAENATSMNLFLPPHNVTH